MLHAYVYCSFLHIKQCKAGSEQLSTVLPLVASLKTKNYSTHLSEEVQLLPQNAPETVVIRAAASSKLLK